MSPRPLLQDQPTPLPVCDLCFSRKVRCDRSDPCGNCQDASVTCARLRAPKRSKGTSRHTAIEYTTHPRQISAQGTPMPQQDLPTPSPEVYGPSAIASTTSHPRPVHQPHYRGATPNAASPLPLQDVQATIQYQLEHLEGLAINRRQILESALRLASQLSESFEDPAQNAGDVSVDEDQFKPPSVEFLTWMLKDLKEKRFGIFVRDYFRHMSEASLKQMGLALLHKTTSPHSSLINTICVNAVAYKFLTTTINIETDIDLIHEMRHSAVQFRSAAIFAIRKIPLLTSSSLELLQALLSGIFLHQGSGDITLCWELTKAACRVCTDLGLDTIITTGGSVTEEQYYCFAWCYVLDKNFAFKMGRFKTLLDIEFGPITSDLSSHQHPMSDLLQIYVRLAKVQAAVVPYLGGRSLRLTGAGVSSFQGIGKHLLVNMQHIQERIEHITGPSPSWKGLDAQSEISALQFAYHSVMTTIFHILEESAGVQSVNTREPYLLAARQEISSLVSMCLSAEKQSTVAFLHWTLLFYPITAYFVLFCNVVATSDTGDFKLMRTIADCLARTTTTSRPIIQVRAIFQHFLSLSEGFFNDELNALAGTQRHQLQPQSSVMQLWPLSGHFQTSWVDDNSHFVPQRDIEDYSELPILPDSEFLLPYGDGFPDLSNDTRL